MTTEKLEKEAAGLLEESRTMLQEAEALVFEGMPTGSQQERAETADKLLLIRRKLRVALGMLHAVRSLEILADTTRQEEAANG